MIRSREVAHFKIDQESLQRLFKIPVEFERLYEDVYKAANNCVYFYSDGQMYFLSDNLPYYLDKAERYYTCSSETITSQVAGNLTRYGVPDTFWHEFGNYYSDSPSQDRKGNIYLLNADQKTLHFCAKDSDEYKEFARRRDNIQRQRNELTNLEKKKRDLENTKIEELNKAIEDAQWRVDYYKGRRTEIRNGWRSDFYDTEKDMQKRQERAEERLAILIKDYQACKRELSVLEQFYNASVEEYQAEIDRK